MTNFTQQLSFFLFVKLFTFFLYLSQIGWVFVPTTSWRFPSTKWKEKSTNFWLILSLFPTTTTTTTDRKTKGVIKEFFAMNAIIRYPDFATCASRVGTTTFAVSASWTASILTTTWFALQGHRTNSLHNSSGGCKRSSIHRRTIALASEVDMRVLKWMRV